MKKEPFCSDNKDKSNNFKINTSASVGENISSSDSITKSANTPTNNGITENNITSANASATTRASASTNAYAQESADTPTNNNASANSSVPTNANLPQNTNPPQNAGIPADASTSANSSVPTTSKAPINEKEKYLKIHRHIFHNPLRIRSKLYLFILLILVFNMLTTTLFGQTLLEKFYTFNKNRELVFFQKSIMESYLSGGESVSEQISEAEKKNITILIFEIKKADNVTNSKDTVTIEYFSRSITTGPNQSMQMPGERGKYSPLMWINSAINNSVIDQLDKQTQPSIIVSNQDNFSMRPGFETGNQSLQIYSKIQDGIYLFLETPREFIAQTAMLAVRYTLYISLFTLGIALILLAFVSKKITKPISNIEAVANKIANMDFTDRCLVESKDELGQLGNSINRMSETLQENIHRLTAMNAILREDLQREEQTNKIRREFIANVSHDFKTPLSLIAAYSESIRDKALDFPMPDINTKAQENEEKKESNLEDNNLHDESELKHDELKYYDRETFRKELIEHCDIIISESNKMDGLVNQLLKLSQLENKMVVLQESMFDLTSYVEEVVYQHQIMLKAKNIKIDFADRRESIAFGDYTKIGQVLNNLFENAIKYTQEDGTIKIWITKEEKFKIHLYNEVANVAEIDVEQLFTSFYKRDQSRSLEDKSYGLGLAIVKAIVELHGNQCGAYKENNGLVFWFEVRVYEEY